MRLYKLFERYIKSIHTEYQYFHLPWQTVMTLVSHIFNQVKIVFKVFCCFCFLSLWSFPSYRKPHSRTSELTLGSELKFINIWSHQINVHVSRFLSWCNSVFITCVYYIHTRKDVSDTYMHHINNFMYIVINALVSDLQALSCSGEHWLFLFFVSIHYLWIK